MRDILSYFTPGYVISVVKACFSDHSLIETPDTIEFEEIFDIFRVKDFACLSLCLSEHFARR